MEVELSTNQTRATSQEGSRCLKSSNALQIPVELRINNRWAFWANGYFSEICVTSQSQIGQSWALDQAEPSFPVLPADSFKISPNGLTGLKMSQFDVSGCRLHTHGV